MLSIQLVLFKEVKPNLTMQDVNDAILLRRDSICKILLVLCSELEVEERIPAYSVP